MKTPLLSVGAETAEDDEHVIASGYQTWLALVLGAVPFIVASFAETKWVIASGLAAVIVLAHETTGRLHDLSVRLRRTNLLLRESLQRSP
jgi:hypothetical protein